MLSPAHLFNFKFEKSLAPEGIYLAKWRIPADLPYFNGHFPGNPILPAVAIIDASVECVRKVAGLDLTLDSVKQSKFMSPMAPGLELVIECQPLQDEWSIDWKSANGDVLAKLRLAMSEH